MKSQYSLWGQSVGAGGAAAVVLAGGKGSRMGALCLDRAKPVLPFLGQKRLIDFTLQNAQRSGLSDLSVLVDHQRESVRSYIEATSPGLKVLDPPAGKFLGTADAVGQWLAEILKNNPTDVMVLAGDHVYSMDYRPMLAAHRASHAGVTVALTRVPAAEASRFGIAKVDQSGRIVDFQEKPHHPRTNLASMGIYAFSAEYLTECLTNDRLNSSSTHDFGASILPLAVAEGRVGGWTYDGYWRDVGTVQSYHDAQMEILGNGILRQMLGLNSGVYPAGMSQDGSWIHPSSTIHGVVWHSIIGPEVCIEDGAVVENSVFFGKAYVGRHARVVDASVDEGARIEDGAELLGRDAQRQLQGSVVLPRGGIVSVRPESSAA